MVSQHPAKVSNRKVVRVRFAVAPPIKYGFYGKEMCMTILIICIIAFIALFLLGACKISSREDEWAEQQYIEYIKSKNNNTNIKGE